MGEAEGPLSNALYSAKLLWRTVSQARVVVTFLNTEKVVKRKVSVQTKSSIDEKGCGFSEKRECSITASQSVKWKNLGLGKKSKSCYLCKLHYQNYSDTELQWPTGSQTPRKGDIVYLPITRSQPPIPPKRSSSLPYYKILKRLRKMQPTQVATDPTLPILPFHLSKKDGHDFQYLEKCYAEQCGFMADPIWTFLMQVAFVDPCIRHLTIALSSLHCRNDPSVSTRSRPGRKQQLSNVTSAIQLLKERLFKVGGVADTSTWETSFVACYLILLLQIYIGNTRGIRYWMRSTYIVLKSAFRVFRSDEMDGLGLPGCMRDVALAFSRLQIPQLRPCAPRTTAPTNCAKAQAWWKAE